MARARRGQRVGTRSSALGWRPPGVARANWCWTTPSSGSSHGRRSSGRCSTALLSSASSLVADSAAGAIEAHDLRMRYAGRLTFLDFHLVVPGTMTVAQSHAICDRIEDTLRQEMQNLVITIHVEPEEKAKQHGVPVL